MTVQFAFADAGEELGGNKGVGKLRPEIVNDQQVAAVKICGEFPESVS